MKQPATSPRLGGEARPRPLPWSSQPFLQVVQSSELSSEQNLEDLPTIDANKAHELVDSGHNYIDVRMPEDFDKGHAPGAHNVPFYLSVTPQVAALCAKDDTFIVGCNTGNRSRFATADLLNAGFNNVKNLGGGYRSFAQSENQQPAPQQ
ncbi:hypothetical protein PR202_gb06265 [Eleusine coracana subsp. coracana]|uniref:Rhodanese domain-containing protein n=1 Tax=Eleusine coracana subsp. coracana TaxID=191504 RepID=A0AAV5E6M7_ELECO|nr:hypothetical protein PR202_gb06265 [Eleusine coracana subsp. coracana]